MSHHLLFGYWELPLARKPKSVSALVSRPPVSITSLSVLSLDKPSFVVFYYYITARYRLNTAFALWMSGYYKPFRRKHALHDLSVVWIRGNETQEVSEWYLSRRLGLGKSNREPTAGYRWQLRQQGDEAVQSLRREENGVDKHKQRNGFEHGKNCVIPPRHKPTFWSFHNTARQLSSFNQGRLLYLYVFPKPRHWEFLMLVVHATSME